LRDKEDQEGLWRGIMNGSVYSLGTDHVPFFPKKGEDLWAELPGVVSFPWELSLLLHFGVHQRGISLSRLVQLNSYHPARRFGLWPKKGALQAGSDADFILVDLDEERMVEHSGKGTCIYKGWRLKGWPVLTVARGAVIYENGAVDEAAFGRGRCVTVPS
jgi:dihydroorotase-like cyclic amidohydrolase